VKRKIRKHLRKIVDHIPTIRGGVAATLAVALAALSFVANILQLGGSAPAWIVVVATALIALLVYLLAQPLLQKNLRGVWMFSAVKTTGLLDIENRGYPSHRLPPEQIFKIGNIRFILISGVLDQLFQRFHADIRDFLERGGQARILLIHPELVRKSLSLNWPAHAKEWETYWITNCNEAQVAVDGILVAGLVALRGFQLRFMRELAPSLGILASDDVDPAQAGIHSFVRIQPISVGNWIGRGIVVTFRKLRGIDNSPYEYFSSDLLNQWNVAVEDQHYLARRQSALTQSK
jgi:hypothetical protein